MPSLKPALLYFALVMGAGFSLGMVRVPLLVPRLGERMAELLEMPVMLVVVVLAARHVVRRFALPGDLSLRLQVGFIALALSLTAELMLAAALQGRSIAQYVASRDPVSGAVYLVLLLLFALMPAILTMHRGSTATRGQAK